ncbi:MAG: glycoside hydrolase family 3 C-terminal domain-containing protein [Conexibacteraceae bacterium]|nr:glycoside hydrolase family 3 C-terminal domain-containing protein [Conexibacteraceae bacterium]
MSADPVPHGALAPWHDTALTAQARVDALIAAMTLPEKLAQLYGVWVGASPVGGDVAPFQHELTGGVDFDAVIRDGLGQLTRPFGSAPVDPAVGVVSLVRAQRRIVEAGRLGIPALAHEECLAGFTAWGATAYPVPLSWGATFDPALIGEMATRIGASMRSVGVHQGLAPVLDVVRDPRWGRVEETIGEDPYLVGTVASAYIRGLESTGIIATLKHFIGYSASRAGRNLAPVSIGPREFADVLGLPFEMALRESGVRSVMAAYVEVDGIPAHADRALLTGLLRDTWGFQGTVVSDYFGVTFLRTLNGIAADDAEAAVAALSAGVDVELPTVSAYGGPLAAAVQAGQIDTDVIDTAVRRVLLQKLELGLLDADWDPLPEGFSEADLDDAEAVRGRLTLDTKADRALARRVAEEAVVLLKNDRTLPLEDTAGKRILVVGPTADDSITMLGCYSFPSHVGGLHPDVPMGIEIPTVLDGILAEFPLAEITYTLGATIDGDDIAGIAPAVAAASEADLVIALLGDRSGLFGRGTSGEGCDAASMRLPGRQQDLLEGLLDTGTPVVAVLVEGRPYALGTAPARAAAIIASFFPGEEGASAIAGVLSGRVEPSGRLPVSVPATPDAQPHTYLGSPLAQRSGTSNLDPTPCYAFGHGLSYTSFEWGALTVEGEAAESVAAEMPAAEVTPAATTTTAGSLTVGLTVRNTGQRAGVDVIQLYLRDPVASVARPVNRLIGYTRVALEAGESATLTFTVPAEVSAFSGRDGSKIVEPGALQLSFGASSDDLRLIAAVELTGETRLVDHTRELHCEVRVKEEKPEWQP